MKRYIDIITGWKCALSALASLLFAFAAQEFRDVRARHVRRAGHAAPLRVRRERPQVARIRRARVLAHLALEAERVDEEVD